MPIIKSAIKKLRQDKKRTARNRAIKGRYKKLLKEALSNPTLENVKQAVSVIDKAAKRNVLHKNKAARLKSRAMRVQRKKLGATVEKKRSAKGKKKSPRSTSRRKKSTEIDKKRRKS